MDKNLNDVNDFNDVNNGDNVGNVNGSDNFNNGGNVNNGGNGKDLSGGKDPSGGDLSSGKNLSGGDLSSGGRRDVYSVGNSDGGEYSRPYVPGVNDGNRSGEYSYRPDKIPDRRYEFSDKAKKKKKRGLAALIAILVCAAILMSAMAGFGGAMLARHLVAERPSETTDAAKEENPNRPSEEPDRSSIVIPRYEGPGAPATSDGKKIGDKDLTIPEVVELVRDSVVEIYTEVPTYNGRFLASGAGSGVIITYSEDRSKVYIATNYHVIHGAEKITVRFTDGKQYDAKLRSADAESDIALIYITPDKEHKVVIATPGSSEKLRVGDPVIAIGNPLGQLGGSVTNGIISSKARDVNIEGQKMTLLQTNAAVNPGNSGGGLFNMNGELIGIVNAKSGGQNVENIGFAIPINYVLEIIEDLAKVGYVRGRVDAGLTLKEVRDEFTLFLYGINTPGVYVVESRYTDMIRPNDRIVSVDGKDVTTIAEMKSAITEHKIGDTVTIRISRGGKQSDVRLTLHEAKPEQTEK